MTALAKNTVKIGLITLMMVLVNFASSQETKILLDSVTIDRFISYCSECREKEWSQRKQLENQKVKIVAYGNIVTNKDSEIGGLRGAKDFLIKQYYVSEKNAKKAKRKAWWRGTALGIGIGAGVTAAILISSK